MSLKVVGQSRVNTKETVDSMPFDWGAIHWLVSGAQMPDAKMTFGYVEIKAGQKNFKHLHPNCDEVLYLLEGELDHSLGEETFHLVPGSAVHIPEGVSHDALNRSNITARMLVAYSEADRQTVTLEDGNE